MGLTGYARNLPDRRVEVLACGDLTSLKQLEAWLWQGSQYADVSDVSCEPAAEKELPREFSTA